MNSLMVRILTLLIFSFFFIYNSNSQAVDDKADSLGYNLDIVKAKNNYWMAVCLTTLGAGAYIVSDSDQTEIRIAGAVVFLIGSLFFIDAKKNLNNARKKYEENALKKTQLGLIIRGNGLGLVLNF